MGFGVAHSLLPAAYRRYAPLIAPISGFAIFCLLTIALSGNLALSVRSSGLIVASLLTALTVWVSFSNRKSLSSFSFEWKALGGMTLFMLLVAFWSIIDQGVDLYLGTSNPDFYQSLSFLDMLQRYNLPFFVNSTLVPLINTEPFPAAFPDALQARFGGAVFAHLLLQITGMDSRPALMTTIVVCLLCLPSVIYFFAAAMLKMDRRVALLSGLLIAISAPISMSFLHIFLGQNTSLALLPFGLTLLYLALKEQDWKLVVFAALIINALIFVYVMMLPYIFAPMGAYAIYKLKVAGRKYAIWLLKAIGILICALLLVHAGMAKQSLQFINDLSALLAGMSQSHYYIDFLTEYVFIYATGVSSYPWSHNNFFTFLHSAAGYIFLGTAFVLAALYFYLNYLWIRQNKKETSVAVSVTLGVYIFVWFYYTFGNLYGYASFKMSAWLSFMVVPFMAYGLSISWDAIRNHNNKIVSRKIGILIAAIVLPFYVGGNLLSSIDYSLKSYGKDRLHGSIINSYGLGGNPDMQDISKAVKSLTPPDSIISNAFSDVVANDWAAYYLYKSGRSAALASHALMPDDEAFLPDIQSGMVQDVKGNYYRDFRPFFKNGIADYFLVPGKYSLNFEIVEPTVSGNAIWENKSVRLMKSAEAKDLLLTGRGFYRIEYFQREDQSWWFPDRIRWSSEGGEILHFNPSQIGHPYRLSFVAIAGHGIAQDTRTIEIFHNGRKIDEQIIYGAARIVSTQYYPTAGMNKLVVRIKEKTQKIYRHYGLWHLDIPLDWRNLNVAFSQFRVLPEDDHIANNSRTMDWKMLLDQALSFNGFNIDGWLRDKGEFAVAIPQGSTSMRIKFQIPSLPEFAFPYSIKFVVSGHVYERKFTNPGENFAEFTLETFPADSPLKIQIIPNQYKKTPAQQGGRDLIQSIHMESVDFIQSQER